MSGFAFVKFIGHPSSASVNCKIAIGSAVRAVEVECGMMIALEDQKGALVITSKLQNATGTDEIVELLYRSDFGKTSTSDRLPYRTQLKRFCIDARYAKQLQEYWKDHENVPIGKLHGIKYGDDLVGYCFDDGLFVPNDSNDINPPIAKIEMTMNEVIFAYKIS